MGLNRSFVLEESNSEVEAKQNMYMVESSEVYMFDGARLLGKT
jgi:hypothetical protein